MPPGSGCPNPNQLLDFTEGIENNDQVTVTTPPKGAYCMLMTIQEYAPKLCPSFSDGYCGFAWAQFPGDILFQ
jgi:hypothetical protein